MRWQKPMNPKMPFSSGMGNRRIPPRLSAKVSSELTKAGLDFAGACACNEGLSDDPFQSGVVWFKQCSGR